MDVTFYIKKKKDDKRGPSKIIESYHSEKWEKGDRVGILFDLRNGSKKIGFFRNEKWGGWYFRLPEERVEFYLLACLAYPSG